MLTKLRRRSRALCASVVLLAAAALLLPATAAPAGAERGGEGSGYLALGDSVPFGFITQAGFEYGNQANFVGYPSYVGEALNMHVVNAACPGETTGSYIDDTRPDNGCQAFRGFAPLHVAYTGSQSTFADGYLAKHHDVRLVSIMLGANDAFLLQKACANVTSCITAGLPALLTGITTNLTSSLQGLKKAHFHGVLVVVNYYSLDYSDPAGTGLTVLLNNAIESAAHAQGAVVADAFTAFQSAASPAGGKTCNAGLLNALPSNQFLCDVHPSQSGAGVLAATVEQAFQSAKH
jgi:lysophospholipase L1-like esterase